jgi:riboflavin kinase/FMN adenylyltransferase
VYRKSLELFEAYFFDFSDDIYGEIISITPLFQIRENYKFGGLEELKNQIEKDKNVMEEWIQANKE